MQSTGPISEGFPLGMAPVLSVVEKTFSFLPWNSQQITRVKQHPSPCPTALARFLQGEHVLLFATHNSVAVGIIDCEVDWKKS